MTLTPLAYLREAERLERMAQRTERLADENAALWAKHQRKTAQWARDRAQRELD